VPCRQVTGRWPSAPSYSLSSVSLHPPTRLRQAEIADRSDHFGEIALIDEDVRSASITAATDLVCYGLTLWGFRPLVVGNGEIAWKLLQSLAKTLRSAET
jgi:CRP-like cAMP-binding protein